MSKRRATSPLTNSTSKRSTTNTTLNTFFPTSSKPSLPSPLVSSDPITDRSSTFIAHAAPITHHTQAVLIQDHIRNLRDVATHPVECDHEILAWRTMTLKVGKTGVEENDWTVKTGGDDDGEKNASNEVHKAIKELAAVDVVVVVSRLYGGIMLGPVRFQHIHNVATQALSRLATAQQIEPLIEQLYSLDQEILQFSSSTASSTSSSTTPTTQNSYDQVKDVKKLERLVLAREKKLDMLKKKFRKEEEELWNEVQRQEVEGVKNTSDDGDDGEDGGGEDENKENVGGLVEVGNEKKEDQSAENGTNEEEEDAEEAALWASLDPQQPLTTSIPRTTVSSSVSTPQSPLTEPKSNEQQQSTSMSGLEEVEGFGLPSEEDAAVGAAMLEVERKKREREGQGGGGGGGFVRDGE